MSFPVKKLRDSLDDDDISDDVDDEVFIRDGRLFKLDDDRGLKRPLMAPHRKFKSTSSYFSYGESSRFRRLRAPFCYTLLCAIILSCLIALALILINMNTNYVLNELFHPSSQSSSSDTIYKPCTDYEIEELWHHTVPKIKSDTPVRTVDVNGDGVEDVVIGYGTAADQLGLPSFTCQMYFGLPAPCAGGILAVDGKTGNLLWQEWLKRSVLKLDCSYDVTEDGVKDCLVSGESGMLCIINGKVGRITWCIAHNELGSRHAGSQFLEFYAGQFIPDVDGDGIVDVITAHTNGSTAMMMGGPHVVILSGATGTVLHRLSSLVSGEMMLTSPHILVKPDGESIVIFCTVLSNSPTSIYAVSLSDLISGDPARSSQVKTIFSDIEGLSAAPILIDMNDDQTEDIVINSKCKLLVFNGLNYSLLLNVSYPFADSYEHDIQLSPIPGYFNNDSIPDFFITYSVSSTDFLYYSVSTVIDGKTGKSLLAAPIIRSNIPEPDASGVTLSAGGYGNDAFVYWMASCVNYESNQDDYNLSGKSYEVDICNARFNTSTEIKLMLLSQHVPSPGVVVYSSSVNFESEINNTANVFEQVEEYIKLNPEVKEKIEVYWMSHLESTPAKCTAALRVAMQRNESPDYYNVPNAYDPEMIPDPVPRSFPHSRFPPNEMDGLNPEYRAMVPDFPSVDELSRDRDERADSGQPPETRVGNKADNEREFENTTNEVQVADGEIEMAENAKENTLQKNMDNVEGDSHNFESDQIGQNSNNLGKTETSDMVDKENDKSTGSKEVMPRKKRESNKIMPRRNDDYNYEEEINELIDEHDLDKENERTDHHFEKVKSELDEESQREKSFSTRKCEDEVIDTGAIDYTSENHGGEEFDEDLDKARKETKKYVTPNLDENHGGESMDGDEENLPKVKHRTVEKIRHAQKYHSRGRKKNGDTKNNDHDLDKTEKNIVLDNLENNMGTYDDNEIVSNDADPFGDDEKYNYRQYLIDLEKSDSKRNKRNKEREETNEESLDDDDLDEDDEEDDHDEDDTEGDTEEEQDQRGEKTSSREIEEEENGKEDEEEDENEEEVSDDDEKEDSEEYDSDEESDDEYVNDDNDIEERMINDELEIANESSEHTSTRNTDSTFREPGRKLIRRRRNIAPSGELSRIFGSETRHRKYFHGPNHKKKESMQEKWWKYIMLTNSEDWQVKKKSIQKEENRLKEDKRKLEERHGNVEGSRQIENRTRELEKRTQQLKEEEENLMKHIPNKKMINLDEQFLNYVKKSLGLKNNDSSISNYDVDHVEQLWDDFIETNVLNHRSYGDDYEFDNLFKDKNFIDLMGKDDGKSELQNTEVGINFENSKHMVSYNLHSDKSVKAFNDSKQEKLVSTSHKSKIENNIRADENDLQQKLKHYTPLDQLKLINRMKHNRTKHNRVVKNNLDSVSASSSHSSMNNKFLDNISNDGKHLKVILKNGENFKYNDYYKWKDNSEYVNFDSYYNILKYPDGWESNDVSDNTEVKKHKNHLKSIKFNHTADSPHKLFSSHNNQSLICNSYFFKRRLECENVMKATTDKSKAKHSSRKQYVVKKIHKKLHEKMQANLGIKHVVVNDSNSEGKGQATVIEKINYKFPFNFGKDKIYSEKDLELFFNNETHAEIKKIMKLNLKKINESITKIKNGSNHWSNLNYYKSHKLIRNKSENDKSNVHTTESIKHNKTTKEELWFNTVHTLKNKQFIKQLKSSTYKTNKSEGNAFEKESTSNRINLLLEHNADLITKKIDLQNNIEQIHISELKNSKNKSKSFPYRRRDKTQDKSSNENRIENLFGLTDSILAKKINETGNKTENTVLGLPVGGKYSSHLNWHEKKYGLPLRNKWESTTEVLANSQRHHRLLKVKKRSLDDLKVAEDMSQVKHEDPELNHASILQKRSTVKKDLSETLKASSFSNDSNLQETHSIGFEKSKAKPNGDVNERASNLNDPISSTEIIFSSNISKLKDMTNLKKSVYKITLKDEQIMNEVPITSTTAEKLTNSETIDSRHNQMNRPEHLQSSKENALPLAEQDNIVKRSIEKYLKILPRASSTPLITSSLTNDTKSLDIIFVSFWVPPKSDVRKLSKSQLDCVEQKTLEAKSVECYNRFGDSLLKEEMAKQCIGLDESGGYNQYYLQGDGGSQFYNPLNLRFGQLSIYRVRIKCKQCDTAGFEPLHHQGWPAGGGQTANGVFGQKHRGGK